MSLEEKVSQLFIIRPESLDPAFTPDQVHNYPECASVKLNDSMIKTLEDIPVGGICFFGKNIQNPEQTKSFIKSFQRHSKLPLFIAVDEEGGRVSRIASTKSFNIKNTDSMEKIGKTGNPEIAYEAGRYISSYLKDFGFNLDFAPVSDINTNPKNIVIGDRAFSENPQRAAIMVKSALKGFHSNKIMACIKHFPGHGDTKDDTHSGYVAVSKTWDEMLPCEIIPFSENLLETDMIMVAHITAINVTNDGLPSSLSPQMITGKLRKELGYDGVIITDALAMRAITKHYDSGKAAIMTIKAGSDILLMPHDFRAAYNAVLSAVKDGTISESRIDQSVRRILTLKAKYIF